MGNVILTGIRAYKQLHIGNYFGAMLPIVDIAKTISPEDRVHMFIPDLHSITTEVDYSNLQATISDNLKLYTAAGLPLEKNNVLIYRQSYVPPHCELTWILDCFSSYGELTRMTQFKDKSSAAEKDFISVGLFNYPVLMASDILLYSANYVPVGDDQTQHLEFTRDIAERFNKKFGSLLVVPEPVKKQHQFFGKDQGLRIKNLIDPTKKMSKSDVSDKGVLFLNDNEGAVKDKIMSAATDSKGKINFDPVSQPGISNLIQIYSLISEKPIDEVAREQASANYSAFKQQLSQLAIDFIGGLNTRIQSVDINMVMDKVKASEVIANSIASEKLLAVQKAVGLR